MVGKEGDRVSVVVGYIVRSSTALSRQGRGAKV
jgi:hypothetical protein